MADDSKAVVHVNKAHWSASFIEELLPAAEKTALLYQLSYLCLANFPTLEKIIKDRAVETQLLLGSSDAIMLKCILTSENLVQLFPMLGKAVEENTAILAVNFLAKARELIKDIISDVDKIVEKYDIHNKDVATSTSDVIKEKIDIERKMTEKDQELKQTEVALNQLKAELQKASMELAEAEQKINAKNHELQDFARSVSQTNKGLSIFGALVPFAGLVVKSIYNAVKDPENAAKIKGLEAELHNLIADKTALKHKEWELQLQIVDCQMKVSRASFERSSIPDPIHLSEVQSSLSKIQAILIQLKNFWESVAQMLDYLEQKTFVGEDLIDDLSELYKEFLDSINAAERAWGSFGEGCSKASDIFKLHTKDAYKFLEVSPSSLSKEEWDKEYNSVKKQLEELGPLKHVTGPETPAIKN